MRPELGSTIFVALVSVILDRLGSYTEDGSCASLERLGLQTIKSDGSRFCVHSLQEAGRRIGEESETQKILELGELRNGVQVGTRVQEVSSCSSVEWCHCVFDVPFQLRFLLRLLELAPRSCVARPANDCSTRERISAGSFLVRASARYSA